MAAHLGEIFEGTISGVMEWGLYVELLSTVEGLVHVNTLTDDYYVFDREHYSLTGETTKRQYVMGQKIKVRVENADIVTKTVDFSPVTEESAEKVRGKE